MNFEEMGTKNLPVLTYNGLNFESWEIQLKHSLYCFGINSWYETSLDNRNAPLYAKPDNLIVSGELVRKVWGFIISSLDARMIMKVDKVPLGELGLLIVTIRHVFYEATPANFALVRKQLTETNLSDFEDVDLLIASQEKLYKHLASMGEVVAEGAKIQKLLESLPECDYGQLKIALLLPRLGLLPRLTWDDHVAAVRNLAQNPNLAGTLSRSKYLLKPGK